MKKIKQPKNWEDEFRSRWMRWLGQKCRFDRPHYVELLSSNYMGWVDQVYDKWDEQYGRIGFESDRLTVYAYYKKAIQKADGELLRKLDNIWCEIETEKKYNK